MHSNTYLLHCNLHGICYQVGKIILCQQNSRYYIPYVCSYTLYSLSRSLFISPRLTPLLLNAAKCEKLKVQNWLHRLHCNFLVTFLSSSPSPLPLLLPVSLYQIYSTSLYVTELICHLQHVIKVFSFDSQLI